MTKEEDAAKKKKKETDKNETFVEKQMTEEGAGGQEGKTVVVAIRMDSQSRELLTWALVKAAAPGDRVVALHVLSSSASAGAGSSAAASGQPAAVFSLAKELDAMLAVYEGFCNLKQIDLKLKICKGSSIRKVLVSEAKAFAASILILGVAKDSRAMGSSSISVAKFCAKKLPSDCSVVALSEGKIFFQREAADNSKSQKKSSKDSSKVNSDENNEMFCLLPIVGTKRVNDKDCKSSYVPEENACSTCPDQNDSSSTDGSTGNNCSICAPEAAAPPLDELKKEDSLALVPVKKKSEAPPTSSMPIVVKDSREARQGWPSLRRLVLTGRKSISLEKHKSSAVQSGKPYSSVHPDRKSKKPDGTMILNLDGENGAVVQVGADSPPPPSVLSDEEGRLPEELESLEQKYSSVCRIFSKEELMQATSNFSPENLIGKGGSSNVYKAYLSDGKELAVKTLKPSQDAIKEFVSEIEIITTLHHKNIISLFGFCFENNSLMLVYDYASRGSLEDILHGEKESKPVLSWPERYKVAIGVAEALDYLHGGGSTEPAIHRDVKSSNILLSEDFEPQLSDFGLATWASASTSQPSCSDVAGTFGYLAPEYILYGKVNEKIDVYAFGVVLLELLSGRKPISAVCPKGQESLVMWAKPILQDGDVKKIIDPGLKHEFDSNQVERMILAASLCVRRLHGARPQIALISKLLRGDDGTVEWARLEVSSRAEVLDDEMLNLESDIKSHLNLALLDVEDDSISVSSTDHTADSLTVSSSVENYLQWRWSRSSNFD
ncbi:putative receptor-like serine/threonine-protein kinase [Canna indica]|uniref:Receptor-like serine/threonine-protein kinase n=1 Tax=Canna indica TaxID=4628 RepID=A0AAQ3JWL6_9LILI|nr:putative receptor-like serine/threonine-protein kinase [Canna indica]